MGRALACGSAAGRGPEIGGDAGARAPLDLQRWSGGFCDRYAVGVVVGFGVPVCVGARFTGMIKTCPA